MRDFNPAWVSSGSFTSPSSIAARSSMSAPPLIATDFCARHGTTRRASSGLMQRTNGVLIRSPHRRARVASAAISRPSALAVLRLSTVSYLVGACTGRSAGLSPLRIRSTYAAARRYWSM